MRKNSEQATVWRSSWLLRNMTSVLSKIVRGLLPRFHIESELSILESIPKVFFAPKIFYRPLVRIGPLIIWGANLIRSQSNIIRRTRRAGSGSPISAGIFFARCLPETEYKILRADHLLHPDQIYARLGQEGEELADAIFLDQTTTSYFHFVTEIVPLALSLVGTHSPIVPICRSWQFDVLDAFGLEHHTNLQRGLNTRVPLLMKKSKWGVYPVESYLAGAHQHLLNAFVGQRLPTVSKLVVSRTPSSSTTGRILAETNMSRLSEKLEAKVIEPASMHPRDQLRTFHQASHVIGPHGSAFANLIASKPGTFVSEIDGPRKAHWQVERLCDILDHKYRLLLAQETPEDGFHYWATGQEFSCQ